MNTLVQDTADGYITVSCELKGQMNINSFSWAIAYDKSKVVPVQVASPNTEAPNTKLVTAPDLVLYYSIPGAAHLAGYSISSFQLENTTATASGNYFMLGYAKNTGATLSIGQNERVTLLQMKFKKLGNVDQNTFSYYHKTVAGTVVSKLIYSTTNVLQYPTSTGAGVFSRPDLFAIEMAQTDVTVSLSSLSAADALNTGDTVYNQFMNVEGETTVTARATYLSPTILASAIVNPVTKTVSFSNLTDGAYVLSVLRNGYMTRDFAITISGTSMQLGDKSLFAGDVYADGIIDGSDSEQLFSTIGLGYGDLGYVPLNDINLDGIVDGTDTEMLFAFIGYDVSSYGETVDYYI